MKCCLCEAEMVAVKEHPPAPRGKFKGHTTKVFKCDNSQHRVTSYITQFGEVETEIRPPAETRADRVRKLRERVSVMA